MHGGLVRALLVRSTCDDRLAVLRQNFAQAVRHVSGQTQNVAVDHLANARR
jgi:hypothetical protein